jgi:acetoin utilization protein AcuB
MKRREDAMSRHTIQRFMTPAPHTISTRQTLAEAHQAMRERGVRHLPVVEDGKLVGVVSQRDLYLLETLRGVDVGRELVEEAMTDEPYVVGPDATLEEVAEVMASRKQGSAVVVENATVVGIFTSTDALRALVTLLRPAGKGVGGGS